MRIKMWIARDADDRLWVYDKQPYRSDYLRAWSSSAGKWSMPLPYNPQDFPQVTWEGEPQPVEVEIKLVPQCREELTATTRKNEKGGGMINS